MQAGRLDQRVTLQASVRTPDAIGEPVPAWSDLATVWANVRDMSGREVNAARAVQSEAVRRVTIRWRADITADMRVLHRGRIMVITAPPREVGRREFLELDCSEGLTDA